MLRRMASYDSDRFAAWYADLEARTLTTLTFPEVRRALEALSGVYVERRDRLGRGADLNTAGKRAAFTLFYGALHLATTWRIAEALELGASTPARIIDLGGGTGVVGIATALACARPAPIEVVDRSAWALSEARQNLAWFGLEGRTRTSDLLRHRLAPEGAWVTLGWAVNELDDHGRAALLATLALEPLEAEGLRDRVILIVGGPRISHELAKELGYDAGFGTKTYAQHVASFAVQEWIKRKQAA